MPPTSGIVAIIGAGSVGSAIAQSLLLRRVGSDLILIDSDPLVCQAQVRDLSDAAYLCDVRIKAGASVEDACNADIVIVTAGAKQRPGDTRLDLVDRNIAVLDSIMAGLSKLNDAAVLLLVANPVDILTAYACRRMNLPKSQVIGTGTLLDSIRLRQTLASKLNVADSAVSINVIGEHGDSQCVAWSTASVAGVPLTSLLPLSDAQRGEIEAATIAKAYEIIRVKGFTSFGIAAVTSTICQSIMFDERQVLPVSHWQENLGCCLSLPATVGRVGIISTMQLSLLASEGALLQKSAEMLRKMMESVESRPPAT